MNGLLALAVVAGNTAARFSRRPGPLLLRFNPVKSLGTAAGPNETSYRPPLIPAEPATKHEKPKELEEAMEDTEDTEDVEDIPDLRDAMDVEGEDGGKDDISQQLTDGEETEAKGEKKRTLPPPPPPPATYPERPQLPKGASPGDIPILVLPDKIRDLFSHVPYLCLGPDPDSTGELNIVPQPLPNLRDLVASYEMFTHCKMDARWGKTQYIRCTTGGTVPDVAIIGRSKVGKTTLINRLAQQPITEKGGTMNWKKVGGAQVTQSTIAIGFAGTPLTRKSLPRFRVYDLPGYGHQRSADQTSNFGNTIFRRRALCRGAVLVVNTPHGIRTHDRQMLREFATRQMPFVVVLNKAEYNVPRPTEENFPGELWQHLLTATKEIYIAADELGCRSLLRGVYVTGSASALGGKAMGYLGVQYAITRLAGLVGEDTWGKPLRNPKLYSQVTPEEAPLAHDPQVVSPAVKYFSPERPSATPVYSNPKIRNSDVQRTNEIVAAQLLDFRISAAVAHERKTSGLSGTRWRAHKSKITKQMKDPSKAHEYPQYNLQEGRTKVDKFLRLRKSEDTWVDIALNGTPRDARVHAERKIRQEQKRASAKAAAGTSDSEARPGKIPIPEHMEGADHWRLSVMKKKVKKERGDGMWQPTSKNQGTAYRPLLDADSAEMMIRGPRPGTGLQQSAYKRDQVEKEMRKSAPPAPRLARNVSDQLVRIHKLLD